MTEVEQLTIYTLGHSNHAIEHFLGLLRQHNIKTVADDRSVPSSSYSPQFNQTAVEGSLEKQGISYVYFGKDLGGHPEDPNLYDKRRHVVYERLASSREFRRGIQQIADLGETTRLTLMCTEENPALCHRHPLLARILIEQGIVVYHIRGNGTMQDAASMLLQPSAPQLPLFEPSGEDETWRSPKPIR